MKNRINKKTKAIHIVLALVLCIVIISILFQISKSSFEISVNLENQETTEYIIGEDSINNINSKFKEINRE